MPPARKPAKRRSKARAHRSPVPWPPRLPVLEQRHLDLIGLGLVAVGVFLAFPLYLRWEGGEAGQAIVDGLTWGIGRVAWATPVALVAAGVLLVLRPALPAGVRPFRAGALCLLGGRVPGARGGHASASGRATARRSPSAAGTSARSWPTPCTRLFSDVGAHILAIFLFCAALLLLTGATVAGVLRATGEQVVETARTLRPPPRPRHEPERDPDPTQPLLPPDLEDEEVVIRPATRTRRARRRAALPRPLRGRRRPAGAARGRGRPRPPSPSRSPMPEPPEPAPPEPDEAAAARAPRPGRGRVPPARRAHPQALERRAGQARHRRPGEDHRTARRGARPPRRAGAGHRRGGRPAHHALRAAARARREDGQGRQPQERPRLRAGRHRDPHPRPDPRQARGRRRGPQPPPPGRHPRRRLLRAAQGLLAADGVAGQGRVGQGDPRRPGQDAPPAGGRHHRRGQVGRHQRDALLDPAARDARRGAPRARRPQAGRAQPLRGDPAPAHAGHHLARGWPPTRCRTSSARWSGATA